MKKPADHGQRHHASVKDAWVGYAFFKASFLVLANVTSRMTTVDRHRRCFETETYTDWPRRLSIASKTRSKKAPADSHPRQAYTAMRPRDRICVSSIQLCPTWVSPPSDRYGRYD
ncbi:hypothetical protein MTO96_013213 [Rhipicephalus appendiculatus]